MPAVAWRSKHYDPAGGAKKSEILALGRHAPGLRHPKKALGPGS